jgi:hypothetical protein
VTSSKQKPLYLLKRLSTLSPAAFSDHWLNVHTAVLKAIPEWPRLRSGYVQNHLIGSGAVGDWAFPYDGVTQVYVRPGTESGPTFPELPVFHEKIVPDESSFLDRGRTIVLKTVEHVVWPGSAPVKVFVFHRRRPGSSLEDFNDHWTGTHKNRVLAEPGFTRHLRGYRQNHLIPGESRHLSGSILSADDELDGASEFWFDTAEEARAAFGASGFESAVHADPSGHFVAARELACLVDPVVILPE